MCTGSDNLFFLDRRCTHLHTGPQNSVWQEGCVPPSALLFHLENDAGSVVSALSAYWQLEADFHYWPQFFGAVLIFIRWICSKQQVWSKRFSWSPSTEPRQKSLKCKRCVFLHHFFLLIGWGYFWMLLGSRSPAYLSFTLAGGHSPCGCHSEQETLVATLPFAFSLQRFEKKKCFLRVSLFCVYSYVCVMTCRSMCFFLLVRIMTVNAMICSQNSCEMWSAIATGQYFFWGIWRDCC